MPFKIYVFKLKFIVLIMLIICTFVFGVIPIYAFCSNSSKKYIFEENSKLPVPIIMYHSILKDKSKSNKYIITPDTLEGDIKYLLENGYTTIFVSDLISYVYNGVSLPSKPIILSFDDGDYNNYTYVFPLLKKYNVKATISVVGYYTDFYSEKDEANSNYGYLRWKDISELIGSGLVEFGNHTYNLHKSSNGRYGAKKKYSESCKSYELFLTSDLQKLQDDFSKNVHYTPYLFTYPYGGISKESIGIIKNIGFKASFSCTSGINYITQKPECLFNLKRNNRPNGISSNVFFSKIFKKCQ